MTEKWSDYLDLGRERAPSRRVSRTCRGPESPARWHCSRLFRAREASHDTATSFRFFARRAPVVLVLLAIVGGSLMNMVAKQQRFYQGPMI